MTFEIYKDASKEYRWRIKARNGKIIADSGEGYKRKRSVTRVIGALSGSLLAEIKKRGHLNVKDMTV